MIGGGRWCLLCCVTVVAGDVLDSQGAQASVEGMLAAVLEANQQLTRLVAELRDENAGLREENARQAGELERLQADLTVLQRMLFGRSSERSHPEPSAAAGDDDAGGGGQQGSAGGSGKTRGPGARAGRRDYSDLPRVEMFWDFDEGGYCCPRCAQPFTVLGDHVSGEQLDWQVIVRVVVHRRRRYKRDCSCRVPATVMAPGPPKAIGKGLFANGFIAMLFTERYVAGRSMNSLVTGLGRQGAAISPATLSGTCAQAGALLVPLEEAIVARSRDSWLSGEECGWRAGKVCTDVVAGQGVSDTPGR